MAIQGSYNLDNALSSQAYAYKCWYNYNYGNNTMGISASDMNEITQTWSGELSNWRATASNDENAYEIEDDDFSKAYNSGKSTVQDKTCYDGGNPTSGDGAGTRGLGLGAGTGDNSGTDAGLEQILKARTIRIKIKKIVIPKSKFLFHFYKLHNLEVKQAVFLNI